MGHETAPPFLAVALSTATGVAFAGDPHRVFKAVDLHTHTGTGAVADTPLDPPVEGFPISIPPGRDAAGRGRDAAWRQAAGGRCGAW